jgi:membrane protein implicated in regulation of membrane protease activity
MLIIAGFVVLLLAPHPWNLVVALVLFVLAIPELLLWNRTVKGRRRVVGTQTLVGKIAEVRVACMPRGQVFVDGALWEAECAAGAAAGTRVRVRAVNGLTLEVEPATPSQPAS